MALLAALLLLMALANIGSGSDSGASAETDRASGTDRSGASSDEDLSEDALDAADDSGDLSDDAYLVDGDSDAGDPGGADFAPVGDGDGADPCAGLPAGQGDLLVVPDPVVLPSGDMDDELHIRNCGEDVVDWTAATKPTVSLASAAGTLEPGELTTVGFVIDKEAWEPGAIDFKIKVSEPGHNEYADVHAYRPLVGADMVGSTELSAGNHVGGCADQCITKAKLIRNLTSPDLGLEVGTTVFAKVRVFLSTQAPVVNPSGNPVFPGQAPKATSPGSVMAWTASLSNLEPATKYFIIVEATDVDGDAAYQSGSFWTITPFEGPDELAPGDLEPGCANFCITKAVITPGKGLAPSALSVTSHTPARFQLSLSTEAPTYVEGVPGFADTVGWENSGLAYAETWDIDVLGLQPGTTYHGIVTAADANDHRSHAVGSFTADGVDVLVTIHKVHITEDGDSGDDNRGELRFAWGVGVDSVGIRGEHKMHDGEEIGFPGHSSYTVHDAKSFLPTVYVSVSERDADGLAEFCTMGLGPFEQPGSNASCDSRWNVASSGLVQVDGVGSLDDCSTMGVGGDWGDEPCLRLVSEDLDNGAPEFWAIVSYTIID